MCTQENIANHMLSVTQKNIILQDDIYQVGIIY